MYLCLEFHGICLLEPCRPPYAAFASGYRTVIVLYYQTIMMQNLQMNILGPLVTVFPVFTFKSTAKLHEFLCPVCAFKETRMCYRQDRLHKVFNTDKINSQSCYIQDLHCVFLQTRRSTAHNYCDFSDNTLIQISETFFTFMSYINFRKKSLAVIISNTIASHKSNMKSLVVQMLYSNICL